jgi:hypothetical protein
MIALTVCAEIVCRKCRKPYAYREKGEMADFADSEYADFETNAVENFVRQGWTRGSAIEHWICSECGENK